MKNKLSCYINLLASPPYWPESQSLDRVVTLAANFGEVKTAGIYSGEKSDG